MNSREKDESPDRGFQIQERVVGVGGRCWLVRVGIVPPVKTRPLDWLGHAVQSDLIIWCDVLCILDPQTEWQLLSMEMIQNVEQTQTGCEESNDG